MGLLDDLIKQATAKKPQDTTLPHQNQQKIAEPVADPQVLHQIIQGIPPSAIRDVLHSPAPVKPQPQQQQNYQPTYQNPPSVYSSQSNVKQNPVSQQQQQYTQPQIKQTVSFDFATEIEHMHEKLLLLPLEEMTQAKDLLINITMLLDKQIAMFKLQKQQQDEIQQQLSQQFQNARKLQYSTQYGIQTEIKPNLQLTQQLNTMQTQSAPIAHQPESPQIVYEQVAKIQTPSHVTTNQLLQNMQARQGQQKPNLEVAHLEPLKPISRPFPSQQALKNWTFVADGMNCEKVAKSTLERHSKFFWIGGEENAQKLYWAAARAEKATGSMSLVNVEYLLVGKLSDDYARCKTGNLETLMQQLEDGIIQNGFGPFQLSLVTQKRDVTMYFKDQRSLEYWVGAFVTIIGPSLQLII